MFSNLTNCISRSPNHYNGRTTRICKFTPHHTAGIMTAEQIGNCFKSTNRQASSNYGIGNDGTIIGIVDEENGAWTSSSYWNDNQAITVEVSNCEIGGEWRISDAAWNSLVELAVDVCRRYNFRLEYDGTCNGTLTEHRMYVPTSCPGPYLHNRMQELAQVVNNILDNQESKLNNNNNKEPEYTGPITYQAFTTEWLPEVNKCDNTPEGYAGVGNDFISGFRCKPTYGDIIYQAHILNGEWLDEINSRDYKTNDISDGLSYAGIYNTPIDAIKIRSTRGYVDYRVKTKENGWLPWVRQYGDYAGNFGKPIIGIQMV